MDNIRGAAFMVLAMLCFAVEDALIKQLASAIPTGQSLGIICFGAFLAFLTWSALKGEALWQPGYADPRVILRSLCEMIGSCLFVAALALIPLTTASAVIQATPLVVAMGAALFLGQSIGWRRWLAIVVGFIGVLIIIRPGMDGFVPATLLAVGGMFGLATRDLITRSLTVHLTGPQLGIHAFGMVTPAAFILVLFQGQSFVVPSIANWILLAIAIAVVLLAYLALIAATRSGHAGIISSFRYSRMIFALIVAYIAFREVPDAPTVIGATIIIASGIFTLWREAVLRRASLNEKPAL
ncbi:DMT family transporter [Yoonia maricola]|uniref:DMT family transporter n=1 Tax=Yoonia maricola TaxID=420999 RepID=UPI000C23EDC0|nr:DMT family transporter [Yoonia maricola]